MDINQIIVLCASTVWEERRPGLMSLRWYVYYDKPLSPGELRHITKILTKMFPDSHNTNLSVLLSTIDELIRKHKHDLHEWLKVILQQVFLKHDSDMRFIVYGSLSATLDNIRKSFPVELQLMCVYKFLVDVFQSPDNWVQLAALRFLTSLYAIADPDKFVTEQPAGQALRKIISYTQDPKFLQIKNAAELCIAAMWNANTPMVKMMLSELPKEQQEIASSIVAAHMKRNATDGGISGSPHTTLSPKTLPPDSNVIDLSECSVKNILEINQIFVSCASTMWEERYQGLESLRCYVYDDNPLSPGELRHITKILTKMFPDSHIEILTVLLNTINELIRKHKHDLHEWLKVLLQQVFLKHDYNIPFCPFGELCVTLYNIRKSFPVELQLMCVYKFLVEEFQSPYHWVQQAALRFLASLYAIADPDKFVTEQPAGQALRKIISYTQDPKFLQIKNAAELCIAAMWNANTPMVKMMLSELPIEQQEIASSIVAAHMKKNATDGGISGSPHSTPSPKTLPPDSNAIDLSECSVKNILDVIQIIVFCASTVWEERCQGLESLRCYVYDDNPLSPGELKHITEILTKMFPDSHIEKLTVLLNTINELIRKHRHDLHEWLKVLLQQVFLKHDSDMQFCVHGRLSATLDNIRKSFPVELQLMCVYKFLVDVFQSPDNCVLLAALRFLASLYAIADPDKFVTEQPAGQALHKIISYTQDPKFLQIRNAAKLCIAAMWNANTPMVKMMLSELPKEQQEIASSIVAAHMKKNATDGGISGSPHSTPSPKTLPPDSNAIDLSECSVKNVLVNCDIGNPLPDKEKWELLEELVLIARLGNVEPIKVEFKRLLRIFIDTLNQNNPRSSTIIMQILAELFKNEELGESWSPFTELILMKVFEAYCSEYKEVITAVEETIAAMRSFPFHTVTTVLMLVIQMATHPNIKVALKMLQKFVEMQPDEVTDEHLAEIMPRLVKIYRLTSARMCDVFCMLAIFQAVGAKRFLPHIKTLTTMEKRFLYRYIDWKNYAATTPASS